MNSEQPWRPRQNAPDVSQALENSQRQVFSLAAWLNLLTFTSMACMVVGGVASLLDRFIQGKDYVPYIGVWTAVFLFVVSGFASTSLLAPRDQPVAKFAMAVVTIAVGIMAQTITNTRTR